MSISTQPRQLAVPLGYACALLTPDLAVRADLISFNVRFHALIIVSAIIVARCVLAGYSLAELGLSNSRSVRHWLTTIAVTVLLIGGVWLEAQLFDAPKTRPDWSLFVPFYVLVSSPCQEIVCRAILKAIAERLGATGTSYVVCSSLAFSVLHAAYGDALLLINTFFAGLAWSAIYLATRTIWPVAASHAVVGLVAFWLGVA